AGERALVDRLELHRRLVGFDLGEDVAGLHGVALALQPFGDLALGHGRREGRHQHFDRHRVLSWIGPGHGAPGERQGSALRAHAGASTSVHSSLGSGSGLSWANSDAAVTTSLISLSICLRRASSARLASIRRFFTWSIGSCSWRIRLTSSLLRYF